MDVFEKVQKTRPEIEGADENLDSARASLLAEISAEKKPARPRVARRPWIIAGGLVGAAAATAAVIVVANLAAPAPSVDAGPTREPGTTLQPSPQPEPTADPVTPQSVLSSAANTAAGQVGLVAGPGQYLKVEHVLRQLVLYSPEDPHTLSRTQATSAWVATSSYTSYIPGTPTDEWVDVFHPDLRVVELYGADAEARSQEWMANFTWMTEPSYQRYQGGRSVEDGGPVAWIASYPEMPRDPAALIEWVRGQMSGVEPGMEDSSVVTFLMQELQLDAAPGDLRAAMYRALALMPGGVIEASDGDVVTLGFATYPPLERWDTITIDTRTATVLSVASSFGSGGTVVPDSVPNHITTQTISVVDSAP